MARTVFVTVTRWVRQTTVVMLTDEDRGRSADGELAVKYTKQDFEVGSTVYEKGTPWTNQEVSDVQATTISYGETSDDTLETQE